VVTEDRVRAALEHVIDPEIGMDVVTLGLVYAVDVHDGAVRVAMTMTTRTCPLGDMLAAEAETAIRNHVAGATSVRVDLVWEPAWQPSMMSSAAKERLGWS
jgi:metal-sulfur cluster biosynthetic enzyme